jgi:DNA-binding response OmpR family regulator
MSQILVVEDEPSLARLLSRILTAAGFEVTGAATGTAALRAVRATDPDLVILDLILPDMRGESVLTELMATRPGSRVLVLSSVTQIATRVGVLEGGAVDFLAKPFANAELLARVKARIRTDENPPPESDWPKHLRRGGLELDLERREIISGGKRIELTQREFVLLSYLLQRAPAVCSRAELMKGVWGTSFDGGTNVVDVCVKRLRWKLTHGKIETVRNVGYRLVSH